MMTGVAANQIVQMLRSGAPASQIFQRANQEYEPFEGLRLSATAEEVARCARELRSWIEAALAVRPPPANMVGLCLSVNIGVWPDGSRTQWLRFEGYPDPDRDQDYGSVDLWPGVATWTTPVFDALAIDFSRGQELAIVFTAILVREAFAERGLPVDRPLAMHVRPEGAGETIQVGRLSSTGLDLTSASQDLWTVRR